MGILKLILSWFGGGPLDSIMKEIGVLYTAHANATTEVEKARIQERIDALHVQADEMRALLADTDAARAAAKTYPTWMAILGFMIGFPFALHLLLVGLATTFQPLIINGWFDWMLHIPKLPPPLDAQEIGIIAFFFGGLVGVAGAGALAKFAVSKVASKAGK